MLCDYLFRVVRNLYILINVFYLNYHNNVVLEEDGKDQLD
jgi:hypothetical protein